MQYEVKFSKFYIYIYTHVYDEQTHKELVGDVLFL